MWPIRGLDWPSSDRDQALHHRPGVTVNTWLAHNYHYTLARQIWGVPASENEPGCIIMLTFTEMHLSPAHWTPDFDRPTYVSLTGFISMCLIQFRASFVYPSILILTPITRVQLGPWYPSYSRGDVRPRTGSWLIIWSPFVRPVCSHSLQSPQYLPMTWAIITLQLCPAVQALESVLCLDMRMFL